MYSYCAIEFMPLVRQQQPTEQLREEVQRLLIEKIKLLQSQEKHLHQQPQELTPLQEQPSLQQLLEFLEHLKLPQGLIETQQEQELRLRLEEWLKENCELLEKICLQTKLLVQHLQQYSAQQRWNFQELAPIYLQLQQPKLQQDQTQQQPERQPSPRQQQELGIFELQDDPIFSAYDKERNHGHVVLLTEREILERHGLKKFINITIDFITTSRDTSNDEAKIKEVTVKHSIGNEIHRKLFIKNSNSNPNDVGETTHTVEITVHAVGDDSAAKITGFSDRVVIDLCNRADFLYCFGGVGNRMGIIAVPGVLSEIPADTELIGDERCLLFVHSKGHGPFFSKGIGFENYYSNAPNAFFFPADKHTEVISFVAKFPEEGGLWYRFKEMKLFLGSENKLMGCVGSEYVAPEHMAARKFGDCIKKSSKNDGTQQRKEILSEECKDLETVLGEQQPLEGTYLQLDKKPRETELPIFSNRQFFIADNCKKLDQISSK